MHILFSYICETYEATDEEEIGDYVYIYDAYDESKKFFVKMKKEKLKKIENQWAEVYKKKPTMVFIKKEGENYTFDDSGYGQIKIGYNCEKREIKRINFEKNNIFKIPGKIFDGGFHHVTKKNKKYFELINRYSDEDNVIVASIKFEDDFTVNHAFFPENWSIEYIKKQILKSLKYLFARKYIEVENKIFSFYGKADGGITIQTIFNNKGEILTAYPLIGKIKK